MTPKKSSKSPREQASKSSSKQVQPPKRKVVKTAETEEAADSGQAKTPRFKIEDLLPASSKVMHDLKFYPQVRLSVVLCLETGVFSVSRCILQI